jgi:TetR/AcrR family transcriptional regulator, transcriptional repressor for nem operon
MRHSKAQMANTHKRIVAIAAKKFREEGLTGITIAVLALHTGSSSGTDLKYEGVESDMMSHPLSHQTVANEAVACLPKSVMFT